MRRVEEDEGCRGLYSHVGGVGRVGFEDELVHADGDGADEEGVEFLIVLRSGDVVLDSIHMRCGFQVEEGGDRGQLTMWQSRRR